MAHIHTVKKSRVAPGKCGKCGTELVKGDPYRWVQLYHDSPKIRCMKPECSFRDSDLTGSDKFSRVYQAREAVEDAIASKDLDAVTSAIEEAASTANEVADEYEEGISNMPDGLQQGDVAQQNQERADGLRDWASELEGLTIDNLVSSECGNCGEDESEHDDVCDECGKSQDADCHGDGDSQHEYVEKSCTDFEEQPDWDEIDSTVSDVLGNLSL